MQWVRTADECFDDLTGYPYAPKTIQCGEGGPRMAYVAEGPHENDPIVLLHGGPVWSYLWRRCIPGLIEGGYRALAPDLVGFGRSDKPLRADELSIERHVIWLGHLLDGQGIAEATLVGHGLAAGLAIALLRAHPGRFDSLTLVSPVFERNAEVDQVLGELGQTQEVYVSEVVSDGCVSDISALVGDGYDAPFDDESRCAGLAALHGLLGESWEDAKRPAIGVPVLDVRGPFDTLMTLDWDQRLPVARRPERRVIRGAGHYLPEERGAELSLAILDFFASL